MTNPTLILTKKASAWMMTHEQIQQMFSEESDDDECFGFELILLILVRLIHGFDSRGSIGKKPGVSYTRVLLICKYIQ